jgi:hypothetical protein
MVNAREKATLDIQSNLIDARHEGEAKGEMVGRIRTYQEILGEPLTPREELLSLSASELESKILDLQSLVRSRKA